LESLSLPAELLVVPNYQRSPQQISAWSLCRGKEVFSGRNLTLPATYELLLFLLQATLQNSLQVPRNAQLVWHVCPFFSLFSLFLKWK